MGVMRRATLAGTDEGGGQIALEVSSMTYDWFMDAKRRLKTTNSGLLQRIRNASPRGRLMERDIISYLRMMGFRQPREEDIVPVRLNSV